jgi:hypothetical protein
LLIWQNDQSSTSVWLNPNWNLRKLGKVWTLI